MSKMASWRSSKRRRHTRQECAMFDEPPSLPMRAAIASFLGSLFGIGLILGTNAAQSQMPDLAATVAPAATVAAADPSTSVKRGGDALLRSLRGSEPALTSGTPGARALRVNDSGNDAANGLRWQIPQKRVLRSQVENPRGNDQLSVGVQLNF
jgi:hypothetical protein